ncbi:MAG: glycosyltransferase [Parasphingorhabdus sp.]|uniref:glycosyltransferase n=1 Tax=Parasphingorhabdus sp. TaxID=2709688 RepID=UPI0030021A18
MKSQKILLTLHMLAQGGTDRVACILASGFVRAGYDTTMLVFCNNGEAQEALSTLIDTDVKLVFLSHYSISRPIDLIRLLPKCAAYIAKFKPDFIVSTGNNINWITAAAVRLSGINGKLILKITNPLIRTKDKRIKRAIRKLGYNLAFKQAYLILPLCDAERKQLITCFPKAKAKFRTVINPYVTPTMLEQSEKCSPYPGRKIVLGVGRFQAQKRFDLLIRSFALIKDPTAKLVILGDGPERQACKKLIEELELTDRVLLPGFVTNVAAWYQTADVFVLSSNYEGLPAVVLEALAGNCPVLSTNCFPAAREILEPLAHCGIIDPPSAANIADSINIALNMQQSKNLSHAANKYSLENGISSHIDCLLASSEHSRSQTLYVVEETPKLPA